MRYLLPFFLMPLVAACGAADNARSAQSTVGAAVTTVSGTAQAIAPTAQAAASVAIPTAQAAAAKAQAGAATAIAQAPTVGAGAVTQAAKAVSPSAGSSEQVAEAYIRAYYAGDIARQQALFPASRPDPAADETQVTLEELTTRKLTPTEAGDTNPLTKNEYTEVKTRVRLQDRTGRGDYQIVTTAGPGGAPVVIARAGSIQWDPPR